MGSPSNADILAALTSFQKESGLQREAIISGINDLNTKVAVQNGRVLRLEEDVRGTEGIHRRFQSHVKSYDERVGTIEKTLWKYAGGMAALVVAIEIASHLFKFK